MTIKNIQRVIFQKIILFSFVSVLMFIVLYFLTLATTTNYSLEIFITMNGILYTILTFLMDAIISLLFGTYVTLIVYKFQMSRAITECNKENAISLMGFASGILGAGCPMCGSLIFGLLGAPLVLFLLPFKGLELRALSIILLLISIFFLVKNLERCGIKRTRKV